MPSERSFSDKVEGPNDQELIYEQFLIHTQSLQRFQGLRIQ